MEQIEKVYPARTVHAIPVTAIRPNPYQPRKVQDECRLLELAHSIRQYGVLQPIQVRQAGRGFYELVAGERRLRAARLAGLSHIPAFICTLEEQESAVLALVENLQREQLHYLEEAEGYINLAQEHGLTQEDIARRIGKTQSAVANKMRLMRLPRDIRRQLMDSNLTERHARALLRLDEAAQQKALSAIIERGLNVREAEALVEKMLGQAGDTAGEATDALPDKRIRRIFRDYRLLTNALKAAVRDFRGAGLAAEYSQKDDGDYIDVHLRVPKRYAVHSEKTA
nr:ParB/RepB/Spo0J family partition protein [bacterium]